MRNKLNESIKGEAFKMRDIAVGPSIALMVIPKVLIAVVVIIAIFAIVKIVKISKNKRYSPELNATGSAAPSEKADKKEDE